MPARSPAEEIEARLAKLLGPNTAHSALRTFCQAALGIAPEALTAADAPRLLAALRPALRTLLGAAAAEQVLGDLARER
jgi:hypothetical protein